MASQWMKRGRDYAGRSKPGPYNWRRSDHADTGRSVLRPYKRGMGSLAGEVELGIEVRCFAERINERDCIWGGGDGLVEGAVSGGAGNGDFVQGVAAGSGAADVDEQPRPGGGG